MYVGVILLIACCCGLNDILPKNIANFQSHFLGTKPSRHIGNLCKAMLHLVGFQDKEKQKKTEGKILVKEEADIEKAELQAQTAQTSNTSPNLGRDKGRFPSGPHGETHRPADDWEQKFCSPHTGEVLFQLPWEVKSKYPLT